MASMIPPITARLVGGRGHLLGGRAEAGGRVGHAADRPAEVDAHRAERVAQGIALGLRLDVAGQVAAGDPVGRAGHRLQVLDGLLDGLAHLAELVLRPHRDGLVDVAVAEAASGPEDLAHAADDAGAEEPGDGRPDQHRHREQRDRDDAGRRVGRLLWTRLSGRNGALFARYAFQAAATAR
jgi:hypothetical protein